MCLIASSEQKEFCFREGGREANVTANASIGTKTGG
jgi:hypothetical protein